jgi:endogenous inhibitor of DNA gyrase (YacG/DUF329 family)
MTTRLVCPTCQQSFFAEKTTAMPFCSRQCQTIDLAHWLNEEIGMPAEPSEGEEAWSESDGSLE